MPSYWIMPQADLDVPLPKDQEHPLSESFYGLIGGGTSTLFDAFPPVFTQVQELAGVDVDSLLPLYFSARMTDYADRPAEIERVAKDLKLARDRFRALYEALLARPAFARELVLPAEGYAPDRAYFEEIGGRPAPPREQWEIDAYGDEVEFDEEPSFGADLRFVLRFLDHAAARGASKFWFLGR